MAFGLAVSIYNLFQRISDLLKQGGQRDTGGGTTSGGGSNGGDGNTGSEDPYPENPYEGTEDDGGDNGELPPTVTSDGGSVTDGTTTETSNCPPLSLADRLKIYAAQYVDERQSSSETEADGTSSQTESDVLVTQATGTPVESSDYFRFRAISTSDVVDVSFFGRIQLKSGKIIPFNRTLTTTATDTLYEVTMQGAEGYLLGAAASVPINSITAGTVNAIGEIGRISGGAFTPHTLLFSGQLDDLTPLSDSNGSINSPTTRVTIQRFSLPAASDAISEVTITIPNGQRARVMYVAGEYDCSAVAGNRQVTVAIGKGSLIHWRQVSDRFYTANQKPVTRVCIGNAIGTPPSGTLPANFIEVNGALPETLYWYDEIKVQVSGYGIQAGDAVTGGTVDVEFS